jgi:hypothetical protein
MQGVVDVRSLEAPFRLCSRLYRRQAQIIEFSERLFAHEPGLIQPNRSFMYRASAAEP